MNFALGSNCQWLLYLIYCNLDCFPIQQIFIILENRQFWWISIDKTASTECSIKSGLQIRYPRNDFCRAPSRYSYSNKSGLVDDFSKSHYFNFIYKILNLHPTFYTSDFFHLIKQVLGTIPHKTTPRKRGTILYFQQIRKTLSVRFAQFPWSI